MKALGFAKISARPRHYAQNELAVEAFKKNFPAELAKIRARLPKGVEIELWWQDEARIGQKNKLTRRWARRGTRPRAPRDQRTEWAYIFGAICPAKGKGAGLVMPWCDTDAMAAHLIEISAAVDPGAHAVLIVDQAGWHLTPKLAIPDNITVLALPPRSPELNPVENVWQFMRDNWLSNRIFKSYEDIVALCCQAYPPPWFWSIALAAPMASRCVSCKPSRKHGRRRCAYWPTCRQSGGRQCGLGPYSRMTPILASESKPVSRLSRTF